ncbi:MULTISPECIES: hypothetical protein [unclassified Halomonas]|uniref:hypothetical protein n=1 Tax=unclassified Halomonas TaxID=2609666 RepID=UPI0021E39F9D|nr:MULTISPECIES: hypothetical protein [unclassified Halomonas]UYF98933.1 hypothetical protein OCT39_11925 [Halomonas sp. GD1P12]WNL39949.1 hypothetical protein RN346_05145 [Halomonas sp. PAMB 3232]WNL43257.1 hypothetical protein RN347_04975 [Halomonas sp. PAMB 3264]
MRRLFVLPTSRAGWGLLAAFIVLVLAGTWPVIGFINQAALVFGLPLMIVWSYVVIFSCVGVMLVGNRLVERDGHE